MHQLVLDPISAVMGRITKLGTVYTAYTGWDECSTGADGSLLWRGYLSYDTSAIPTKARLLSVELYIRRRTSDPLGEPEEYGLLFLLGTFVGDTLDGTSAEWLGGSGTLWSLDEKPPDKTVSQVPSAYLAYINRSGVTDVKLRDVSNAGDGDTSWGTNFNRAADELCQLFIYYEIVAGTATGVGSATCSATVTAVGTGTATGVGSATCAATVAAQASASATGAGTASCVASATAQASLSATGQGFAICVATVTAEASAIATGVGDAVCVATVVALASLSATGVGAAACAATVTAQASATATGLGDSACIATVAALASGSSTGVGSATCSAVAAGLPRGEATGVGSATCVALAINLPLARHSATLTIAAAHSATVSIQAKHEATCSCSAADSSTCGPRRND